MKYILILIFILVSINISYSGSLRILFLGDTHFGDNYQLSPYYNHGVNVIEKYGYDYFFENVKDLLLTSDLTIANLETPLTDTVKPEYFSSKSIIHFSDKDSTPFYLIKYRIDAVSIANNHILDLGLPGLENTRMSLENYYGILTFGAGINEREASEPLFKTFLIDDVVTGIYVIGCYWYRTKYDNEKKIYAHGDTAGVRLLDVNNISKQVKQIKTDNPNAYVVVYPHWGSNYMEADDNQHEAARSLIDCGVDLIIGHGAHTIQEIEYYNRKWIFYNMGNFIFNSPGKYSSMNAKPYGFILQLIIDEKSKRIRLYPIFTNNKETDYQIRYLNKDEFDDCYEFVAISDSFKNKLKKIDNSYFEIELD